MKRFLIMLVSCLSFINQAPGQSETKVNINQLLKHALENNAGIKRAELSLNKTRENDREVRSSGYPQINGELNYKDYLQLPTTILPGDLIGAPGEDVYVNFGKKHNADIGVSLSQLLFSMEYFQGVKASKIGIGLAELNIQKIETDIIYDIHSNYYQLLAIYKNKEILEAAIASLKQTRKSVAAMANEGLALQTDVKRIDVNISDLDASYNKVIAASRIQINKLKLISGIAQSEAIWLDTLGVDKIFRIENRNESVPNNNLDISQRIEMQLLCKNIELKEQQVKVEKGKYSPTIVFLGAYQYQAMGNEFNLLKRGQDWFDVSLVGVKVKVPVFKGRETQAKVAQVNIEKSIIENDRQYASESMQLAYRNALSNYQLSYKNCMYQTNSIRVAEDILSQNQLMFKEGVLTLTDLLISENDLRSAQIKYVQNVIYLKKAELDILKSHGKLITLIQD